MLLQPYIFTEYSSAISTGFSKGKRTLTTRSVSDRFAGNAQGPNVDLHSSERRAVRQGKKFRQLVTIKRNDKFEEAFDLPKVLVLNPRSIYNKIDQFKTFIIEKDVDLVFMSESWERHDEPLTSLINVDNYKVISNPFQRKNTGGKPALVVNTNKFVVDDPNQTLINIPWGVEIVWGILTPKKLTNSSRIKKIIAASFYCKPGSRKKKLLLDHISEVYHFLSSKFKDIFWIFGADKNDLKVDTILHLNPNLRQCVDFPTRQNSSAIIDIVITDLHKYYQTPVCEAPLDVDVDKMAHF